MPFLAAQKIHGFALTTPDAPALIWNLEPISFREFDRRIRAVAVRLISRGLRPGGVVVTRVGDLALGWAVDIALRGLGHTTMAIRSPAELDGLEGVDLVGLVTLTGEPGPQIPANLAAAAVRIELREADFAGEPGDTAWLAQSGGDHILLTSATTGRYKMILHTAAQDEAAHKASEPLYGQLVSETGRRVTVNYFDFGLWTAAIYGAALLIWSYGQTVVQHRSSDLYRSLNVPGLSYAVVTPAMLARIMASPAGSFPRQDAMQLSLVAGALSESLFHQARERLTNTITTGIGSSEGGTWATTQVKTVDDLRWHQIAPNRKVEIVDENDQPLPPGKLGQIRVSQTAAVGGYLHDAAATERFFRDGWFYPGDLGVIDAQGRIAMFGRVTDVINRGGDKLPAVELEAAMQQALGVEHVCLLSEQGAGAEEELHVVIETAVSLDQDRLHEAARGCLGGFRQIHFHFLPELPRNAMGKVERLKLRQQLSHSPAR